MSTGERSSVAQGDRYTNGSIQRRLCFDEKKNVEEVKEQIHCRKVSNIR